MWLNRLQYKYNRYAIPNLTLYLVIGRIFMYLLITALPQYFGSAFFLPLSRWGLMQGRIWEIFTFIITPNQSSPIYFLIDAYLFYFIGTTLENIWGNFKYNVFILLSMAAGILSCLLVGVGTAAYLSTIMFIAFAIYFPDHPMLLFYILPIPAKFLGLGAGFLLLVQFLSGNLVVKVNILLATVVLFVFFGKGLIQKIKEQIQLAKRRQAWKNANQRFR